MKYSDYVKLPGTPRKRDGATMAFVASIGLVLVALGTAFFYITESVIGGKQVVNDTDAATLASARAIEAVCLTPKQVAHMSADPVTGLQVLDTIPQQFVCSGFDANGNGPTGTDANGDWLNAYGQSIPSSQLNYTISSYNKACGYTLMACLTAANDGSPTAIQNAANLARYLRNFSNALSGDIANAAVPGSATPSIITAFTSLAGNNWANVLPGLFSSPKTIMKEDSLKLGCYTTAQKAANIYLPNSFTAQFAGNATINNWLANYALSSVTATDAAANGAKLITGGVPINLSQLNPGFGNLTLELVPYDVGQVTHSISTESFNNASNIINPTGSQSANFTVAASYTPAGFNGPPISTANVLQLTANSDGNFYLALPAGPGVISGSMWTALASDNIGMAVTVTGSSGQSSTFSVVGPGTGSYSNDWQLKLNNGSNNNFAYNSAPTPAFPYNVLQLVGQTEQPTTANAPNKLSLSVLSSALAGMAQQFPGQIPPNGYVRVILGSDIETTMATASQLQLQGYSNVELEPNGSGNNSINLTYDAGMLTQTMFDLFSWADASGGSWIIVGTDQPTGVFSILEQSGITAAGLATPPLGIPPMDYKNNLPNIPFTWTSKDKSLGLTKVAQALNAFSAWINYNNGVKGAQDPYAAYGGTPWLLINKPNFTDPNGTIRAAAIVDHKATVTTLANMKDILIFSDSSNVFTSSHPFWMDDIMPIISTNYGVQYLPTPITPGGFQTAFTADEYAKAQVIALFDGRGLYYPMSNPTLGIPSPLPGELPGNRNVPPSNPGTVYLPMNAVTNDNPYPLIPGQTACSGMRDFIGVPPGGYGSWPNLANPSTSPYIGSPDSSIQGYNQNILVHHAWNSQASVGFMQPASPFQLMYDINVLNNGGTFSATDSNLNSSSVMKGNLNVIMTQLLTAVQSMNPARGYTMQDLITVLSSQAIDLSHSATSTIYYLSDNNGKLQLSTTIPKGDNNQPADGTPINYATTYEIAGGIAVNDAATAAAHDALKTIVDTAKGDGAAYGDVYLHECPYRGIYAAGNQAGYIYTENMVQFTPGSGAASGSPNHGDLKFYSSSGPSMQFSAIN